MKRKNFRQHQSSNQWEESSSEGEEPPVSKRGRGPELREEEEEDEWEKAERMREEDLLERDALDKRIKEKDKEKTRKIMEKSDKKVRKRERVEVSSGFRLSVTC